MSLTTAKAAIAAWVESASGVLSHWAGQNAAPPPVPYVSLRFIDLDDIGFDWTDVEENPLTLADDASESVSAAANTLTLTAHAYVTGDGPVQLTTTGTLPGGLEFLTDYWIIVVDANTISLAVSHYDARQGTAIDLTDAGSGTHTIVGTEDTRRSGAEIILVTRGARTGTLSIQCFAAPAIGSADPLEVLNAIRIAAHQPARMEALNAAGVGVGDIGRAQEIDGVIGDATFEPRAVMTAMIHLAEQVSSADTYIEYVHVTGEDPAGEEWFPSDPTA